MAPARLLERNVRPKRTADEAYDAFTDEEGSEVEGESDADGLSGSENEAGDGTDDETGPVDAEELESEDGDAQHQISNVSFGALKQAQDALSRKRKRKRGSDVTEEQDDKLEALRKRLRQIKEEKAGVWAKASSNGRTGTINTRPTSASNANAAEDSTGSDENSDSAPSEQGAPAYSRGSKHAPMAQSTRHQVSRKRTVVDVPKRIIRDPRFDALQQQQRSAHQDGNNNSEKAYGFLRDYQKSEISELKSALKRSKNEDDKITLRRKVNSMENRLKAKDAKEREQEVLRRHRREEKERVEQGKTPFYLKRKEVKERALVEKFRGMKGKERQKVVEKRKRKEGQRERKRMPVMRRGAG